MQCVLRAGSRLWLFPVAVIALLVALLAPPAPATTLDDMVAARKFLVDKARAAGVNVD